MRARLVLLALRAAPAVSGDACDGHASKGVALVHVSPFKTASTHARRPSARRSGLREIASVPRKRSKTDASQVQHALDAHSVDLATDGWRWLSCLITNNSTNLTICEPAPPNDASRGSKGFALWENLLQKGWDVAPALAEILRQAARSDVANVVLSSEVFSEFAFDGTGDLQTLAASLKPFPVRLGCSSIDGRASATCFPSTRIYGQVTSLHRAANGAAWVLESRRPR